MRRDDIPQFAADVRAVMLQTEGLARAYWNNAPEARTMPYLVYDIRAIGMNRLVIECDLWGTKGNELNLWNMADALEENLDGYIVSNEYHAGEITSNNDKKWVDDDDERIIRINMSFGATYQA